MKVAFIIVVGGFLGSETALMLEKEGIKIAVNDINGEALNATVERIRDAGGFVKAYPADVTNSAEIDAAIVRAAEELSGLDIMIHVAAGGARIAGKDVVYRPLAYQEDWILDYVINVNLYGALWSSKSAARIMIEQGRGGKIIHFASTVGINGLKNHCDYAASKGGIMSLTHALAKELGEYNINVNAVTPGIVMRTGESSFDPQRAYKTNLLCEKCKAEDIAELVLFLVSYKARFITGQTYVIYGGKTLSMKGTD